ARRAIGAFDPDLGALERRGADQTVVDDPAQERTALRARAGGHNHGRASDEKGRSGGGATDHGLKNPVRTSDPASAGRVSRPRRALLGEIPAPGVLFVLRNREVVEGRVSALQTNTRRRVAAVQLAELARVEPASGTLPEQG